MEIYEIKKLTYGTLVHVYRPIRFEDTWIYSFDYEALFHYADFKTGTVKVENQSTKRITHVPFEYIFPKPTLHERILKEVDPR